MARVRTSGNGRLEEAMAALADNQAVLERGHAALQQSHLALAQAQATLVQSHAVLEQAVATLLQNQAAYAAEKARRIGAARNALPGLRPFSWTIAGSSRRCRTSLATAWAT